MAGNVGRVRLIVTGELERAFLPDFLRQCFRDQIAFEAEKHDSVTSARIGDATWQEKVVPCDNSTVRRMARAAVAAVDPGRRRERSDMVVIVDDAEDFLGHTQDDVRSFFARALAAEQDSASFRNRQGLGPDKVIEWMQANASFHLLVPMAEAYLFLAPSAWGSPQVSIAHADVEQFETDDRQFLDTGDAENARHPKRFVQFLAGRMQPAVTYRETKQGVEWLGSVYQSGPVLSEDAVRSLRWLLHDIAERFGLDTPHRGQVPSVTKRANARQLLRNLWL